MMEATMTLQSESLTAHTVRFVESKQHDNITDSLSKCHNKKVYLSRLLRRTNLHGEKSSRATLLLEFATTLQYTPGDHVGVYAMNRPELVEQIIARLKGVDNPDEVLELQVQKETHTSNGSIYPCHRNILTFVFIFDKIY